MKLKAPYFIITIMSVALLGSIIIQGIWINDAITVKESNFRRDVHIATNKAISKYSGSLMIPKFLNQNKKANLFMFDKKGNTHSDSFTKAENPMLSNFMQMEKLKHELIAERFSKVNMNSHSHQKIRGSFLDSLIRKELKVRGVKAEFEIGIYNPMTNAMLYQKTGKYPEDLLKEGMVFNIPAMISSIFPDQLIIFFPNERRDALFSLWMTLLVAAIFTILIIYSFSLSIVKMLNQKKISELKNDFINNMTHEFKTPISTINLICESMKDPNIQLPQEASDRYVSIIQEENLRLKGMVERVLQAATIDKGQLNLKEENLSIHEILEELVDKFQIQMKQKEGILIKDFQSERDSITGDRIHVTNLFMNLLDNANKYNLGKPEISIKTKDAITGIVVEVSDNGIGINKCDQKRIFDKLYRVPTGNVHNFKGFGLGLNYVKTIVELHNGRVSLESELNKGSTFRVFLPYETKI